MNTSAQQRIKLPFFYGWVIALVSTVQLSFAAGFGFYGLPLYLRTLNTTRGFSVSMMSLATSLFWVASGLAGIVVAKLLSRIDPRLVIAFGAALGALSIAGLGRVTTLQQVFILYPVFGVGFCCSAVIVTNTVITRWFHRKRSVALSIATTGLSLGGVVLTPQAARLIGSTGPTSAFDTIAIAYFLGVLVVPLLFLRPTPQSMGLAPDGDILTPELRTQQAPGMPFDRAVRSLPFLIITVTFALSLLAQVGGISQLVKLTTERVDKRTGDQILSVLAACSVIGRLAGGAIVQRWNTRVFALCALILQTAGITTIAFASTRAAIIVGAMMFGFGVGNVLLLHPLLVAEVFGVRDYPRIYGRSQLFVAFANAAGPLVLGWLRDNAGGYRTSYLVAAGLNLLGFAVYLARGRVETEFAKLAEARAE